MTTAERLTTVANNVPLVYEAGAAASDGILDGTFAGEYINPRIEKVRAYAFSYATATRIKLQNASNAGYAGFSRCTAEIVELPGATANGETNAFSTCANLKAVDCGGLKTIAGGMFEKSAQIAVVISRKSTITTLSNANAFSGTPFASGGTGGTILCPRTLIANYQSATNWSTLHGYGTCTFLALEDYTLDGTITGELDWDKIETELMA